MESPTRERTERFFGHVLHLLEGLHGPADIAPDRLEAAFGAPVESDPADPATYGIGEALDARWILNLVSIPGPRGSAPTRLIFSCDDQTGRYDDLSALAGLDVGRWHAALTAAGYAARPDIGPRGAFYGMVFERDAVRLELQLRGQPGQDPRQFSVTMIVIDTEARHAKVA
jgi:hypothetical protein